MYIELIVLCGAKTTLW